MSQMDDILDDCLERLSKGTTVEDCEALYPERRAELSPLLETAASTMHVASSAKYRPEAKARGLARLTTAMAQQPVPRPQRAGWLFARPRLLRPIAISLVSAVLATGAALGTAAAVADSVPGEALYWVKTTTENISLMIPQSEMSKAQKHASLARTRSDETERLMSKGKYAEAERHWVKVRVHLGHSAVLVGVRMSTNQMEMPFRRALPRFSKDIPELRRHLRRDNQVIMARFEQHLRSMPPSERQRIRRFMMRQELMYRALIAALESNWPPPWPFAIPEPQRPRR